MFIKQMQTQVGTFSGIFQKVVSLQNMKKVNFMIGTVMVGIDHTLEKIQTHLIMEKLESYL